MDPATIHTRRELARFLQAQMLAARSPWPVPDQGEGEDGEGTSGRTSVKTYLLEAHACDAPTREPLAFLRGAAAQLGLEADETGDENLFRLHAANEDFWCDTSMGRFWRLHTTVPVDRADKLRDALVASSPWLDNVWLPPSLLEDLPARTETELQTFSLSHNRTLLHTADAPPLDFDYVSMRVWASRAAETLAKLRRADVFPHGVSIRSVKLRANAAEEDADFCVSEYFHNGKVTVTGNSFDMHTSLVVQVVRMYRTLVEKIESEFGLGYEREGVRLAGNPVVIPVGWTVRDLEFAVGRMFSSAEPFRLWGVPERVTDDHYRASAVDLHVGQTLTIDVTRHHVVIQLPKGTCGNTVVRFLAALQFHVNSDTGKALLN